MPDRVTDGRDVTTSEFPFAGRSVIVTGATAGSGRAVVERLLERGAAVTMVARKPAGLADAASSLGTAERLLTVSADIESQDFAERVAGAAYERFGGIDMVVNNAAISPVSTSLDDTDPRQFERILRANVVQPQQLVAEARQRGLRAGSIVNVGSMGGLEPVSRFGAYGVSKAALHHLTRQMALEFAPDVRVNAVAPAVFESGFSRPLFDAGVRFDQYPLRRAGLPSDIAELVVFLLSDAAAWITGQVISVDGGFSSRGV